jgi:hypothetical protein
MLLKPRTGFSNHNVTITINTDPVSIIKSIFSTNSKSIYTKIMTQGNYTITALENNYNTQSNTDIFVLSSKSFDVKY